MPAAELSIPSLTAVLRLSYEVYLQLTQNIKELYNVMPENPDTQKRETSQSSENIEIPPISKQTAGAVAGAAVGSIAGPFGAVVGGVVGAVAGKAAGK
jgi:hypothetical protein